MSRCPAVRQRRARRAGSRGRLLAGASFLVAVLALSSACTSSSTGSSSGAEASGSSKDRADGTRIFGASSPWNLRIPAAPRLDAGSDAMVGALTSDGGASALIGEYAVPVYEAGPGTPQATVTCTRDWGPCPLEAQKVPIPADARPSQGSDHSMVVIDRDTGRVYDFWQAERASSLSWQVSWGTWAALDGTGIGGEHGGTDGGATGAGINLLAGVVRLSEVRAGRIDHALAFASSKSCAEGFRYPATKTDGILSSSPCVPEGARIQLDPSIDVTKIPGITPGEVAVAQALQTYGGYVRDTAGSSMAVAFEAPPAGSNPYTSVAKFPWDYYDMPHIPWDQLRVLRRWDGT